MSVRAEAIRINGPGIGPTLAVLAGVHGDEVEPIAALESWVADLELDRGVVIAVPVTHRAAVEANSRYGVDGADMNRSAVGDLQELVGGDDRGPTARLADETVRWLAGLADYLITLHSWSRSGLTVSYVEYSPTTGSEAVAQESRALAHALGLNWIEMIEWHPGLLPAALNRRGIPAVEVEVGGLGRTTDKGQREIGQLLDRALVHLALRDAPTAPVRPGAEVSRRELRSPHAGRVRQLRQLGGELRPGDVVAEIRGHDGSRLAEVAAEQCGYLAVHCTYGYVEAGEIVAVSFEAGSTGAACPTEGRRGAGR